MNVLLLLALSTFVGLTIANTETLFAFSATINCRHQPYWCVQLEYIEKDLFSVDDKIAKTAWQCTYESQQNILTRGTQKGDGILLDLEYELAVRVNHSCRAHGKTAQFVHSLPNRLTEERFAPVDYTLNLDR